jgi:hypothetical protein
VDDGAECGICEAPPELGNFEGQFTDDAQPGEDAWRWRFVAGQVLFSTSRNIALDGSTPLRYCGPCEQDMREERGLKPDALIRVTWLLN